MAKGFTRSMERLVSLYEVEKGFMREGRGRCWIDEGVYGKDIPVVEVGECDNEGALLIVDRAVYDLLYLGRGVEEWCGSSS